MHKQIDVLLAAYPSMGNTEIARRAGCDESTVRRHKSGRYPRAVAPPATATRTEPLPARKTRKARAGALAGDPVPAAAVARMLSGATLTADREVRVERTRSGTTYTVECRSQPSTYLLRIADRSAEARGPETTAIVDADSFLAAARYAGSVEGASIADDGRVTVGAAAVAAAKRPEWHTTGEWHGHLPRWDDAAASQRWEQSPPDFDQWADMADALSCACSDPTRPQLAAVWFPAEGHPLAGSAVACDGYRLGAFPPAAPLSAPEGLTIDSTALHRFTAAAARSGCGSAKGRDAKAVSLAVGGGQPGARTVTLSCGPVSVQTREKDPQSIPNLDSILPEPGETVPAVRFDDPHGAAKWLRSAAKAGTRRDRVAAVVEYPDPDQGGSPTLTAVREDSRTRDARPLGGYPIDAAGPPSTRIAAFDPGFLADAIAASGHGGGPVEMSLGTGRGQNTLKPAVITEAGRDFSEPGRRTLLLPVPSPAASTG